MKYLVVDRQTGETAGTYKSEKRAKSKKDKLDNAYGGYKYFVKMIMEG